MAKIKDFFEDDIFKAKRVIKRFEKRQQSTYIYKIKSRPKFKEFSSNTFKKINTEVVVKITGSAKDFQGMKGHIKYISRDGELELFSSDDEVFFGKDDNKQTVKNFNLGYEIPTKQELLETNKKPKRETLNFVFSMKDHLQAPADKIREAAIKTLKAKFPNNYFVVAIHNDTDNPHCHICLKIKDTNGKRINPNKNDLNEIRKNFALELNKIGIEATATIKKRIQIDKDGFIVEPTPIKAHHYEVISFGEANYKFKSDQDMSYYVRYKSKNGNITDIWSKDLKQVVESNNIRIGEYCRFVITAEQPVKFTYWDKKIKKTIEKTSYKKKWDVSVNQRLEKDLKPLKQYSQSTYRILDVLPDLQQEVRQIRQEVKTISGSGKIDVDNIKSNNKTIAKNERIR